MNDIILDICEDHLGKVVKVGEKKCYNLDNKKASSSWIREGVKGVKTFDAPQLKNALSVKSSGKGRIVKDYIGYMLNIGDCVEGNGQKVALFTSAYGLGNGTSVTKDNYNRCISLFMARKLIKSNWVNGCDEYMPPNEAHKDYAQWENDCVVMSIFNNSSLQSSMRQIEYKGAKHDIRNEFFPFSKDWVKDLANNHNNHAIYNDVKFANDTFVYNKLQGLKLSADVQAVLDKYKELYEKAFPLFAFKDESKHLNVWDAGFYQVRKGVLEENFKDEYKAFTKLVKKAEERMRSLVYELGFLYKEAA